MKLFLSLAALFLIPLSLFAKWDKVMQTTNLPVGCGFFFDKNNGFIGSGHFIGTSFPPDYPLRIWQTNNGGSTWIQCQTPSGTGRITSIFMKDVLVGYASVFSDDYSVWKTTDGGKTWFDISHNNLDWTTSVYATSKALIRTTWDGNGGGFSSDEGINFSTSFSTSSTLRINGIDFSDDNTGVVTYGPHTGGSGCFLTSDGGLTWRNGGSLYESWSVYAIKGTNTFITLPEGDLWNRNDQIHISNDAGKTWNARYVFNGNNFTGHIAGKSQTIYVQSLSNGFFRSDDLGGTWKNVGGPDGDRDTRFAVTGCNGEVVFAFDNSGGVWRTTDGGDGTLMGVVGGPILSYSPDTVKISTFYCQPERGYIEFLNTQCSTLAIDTIFIQTGIGEFTVDTSEVVSVGDLKSLRIPIRFQFPASAVRKGMLRIKAHLGVRAIDTLVPLVGKNANAPEPSLAAIPKVHVGDTTVISIFLQPTIDTFTISRYIVHLSYNTDILSPIDFSIKNTLSTPIINASISKEASGMSFFCQMRNAINQTSDLSKPLISFLMQTYISKETATDVRLDTFSVTSLAPLPLCTVPIQIFTVDKECGDSLLSDQMRYGKFSLFNYIRPNPVREDELEAGFELAEDDAVDLSITDLNGVMVSRPLDAQQMKKGTYTERISIVTLPNGVYSLVLKTSHSLVTRKFVIAR